MQYIIGKDAIIAAALQHALGDVLCVPARHIVCHADAILAVQTGDEKTIYTGLLPLITALRQDQGLTATWTPEQREFVGDGLHRPLVNQWLTLAALLTTDAANLRHAADAYKSLAPVLLAHLDRILAPHDGQERCGAQPPRYLAGTTRATLADVLIYAAVQAHPQYAAAIALSSHSALERWCGSVHDDAYLAALPAPRAAHAEEKGSATAATEAKAKAVYVKPSEAEILRRRQEKELAKAAKKKAAEAVASAAANETTERAAAKDNKSSNATAPSAHAAGEAGKKTGATPHAAAAAATTTLSAASLDIRVGKLTNLRRHPEADRLYVEDMVLGDETRTIVSGLVEHYTPDQLEDTLCLVVCNMKPKPLKGVTSQGMVLCGVREKELALLRPPTGARPGDRIFFAHRDAEGKLACDDTAATGAQPVPEVLSGKKMTDVLAGLHLNEEGVLCWQDLPAMHTRGAICTHELRNCPVK